MAAKNKAASVGAGAVAAGKAAKDNAYVQALIEDEELREAATSLKDAADALRDAKKPKRRGRGLLLIIVGVSLAFVLSEGLRKKALDTLFGAEEEFEYTSPTTPTSNGGATGSTAPAGATS